ncbi:MAG: long-chain N-acyl amino acid synthase [Planctomycetota bacterium]
MSLLQLPPITDASATPGSSTTITPGSLSTNSRSSLATNSRGSSTTNSRTRPAKTPAEEVAFEIAEQRQDLYDAFKLVGDAYHASGLMPNRKFPIRVTPYHLLPTTEVFVTRMAGEIVSTVSLIGDGFLGLPISSMYPDETSVLRESGLRFAEIGALADRRESPSRFLKTFLPMMRLLTQVARIRGYDGLVAACHPKHARLYQRMLPFERIGGETGCEYANGNPAVMLAVHFEWHHGSDHYQRFFGDMPSVETLCPRPWSRETREYFRKFLQSDDQRADQIVDGCLSFAALTGRYHAG